MVGDPGNQEDKVKGLTSKTSPRRFWRIIRPKAEGPGEIAVAKHENKLVFKHGEILEAVADSWSTVFKAKRIPLFANVFQQRHI